MSQNLRARGSTREWGLWVILTEAVEGRGLGQQLRAHSICVLGVPGFLELRGAPQTHWPR